MFSKRTWSSITDLSTGPIVRLGPNEVSTIDLPSVRTIYKVGSPFLKSKWYQRFTDLAKLPTRPIFSMLDSKEHSQHRRIQAFNFSEKWIGNMEPQIVRNINMTVAGMKRETESQGHVDVLKWFTFMATDVIGEASFGESFKLLEGGKVSDFHSGNFAC
jgi:cytochrome P450